jgi:hypothetical protein
MKDSVQNANEFAQIVKHLDGNKEWLIFNHFILSILIFTVRLANSTLFNDWFVSDEL